MYSVLLTAACLLAPCMAASIPSGTKSVGANNAGSSPHFTSTKGSFSLPLMQNPNYTEINGLEAMLLTYVKYDAPLPKSLRKAVAQNEHVNDKLKTVQKRGTMVGTVPAYPPPYYDTEYVVPVKIGTPAQELYLNLDTGSSDLWVFSTDTPRQQIDGHRLYNATGSQTARLQPELGWSIGYVDGSHAQGIVYKDRVQLGNTFFANQAVESALDISPMFTMDNFASGLIGLGMSSGNTVYPTQQKTYLDNIKDQLASPVFTANLRKGAPGNYNFGYINAAEHDGNIQWAPLYPDSPYWQFPVSGYQVGDNAYRRQPWRAVVDTGTTLVLVPGSVTSEYWGSVAGARYDAYWGAVLYPCAVKLPAFQFGIGLYRGLVSGSYLNYGAVNSTHCYGGLQSSDGIGFSVFGASLLRAQFVAFDIGARRVGFANKRV